MALACGGLWALCFGREPLALAPLFGLVPLVLLTRLPGSFASGFLFGMAFWLTSLYWIPATLVTYGGVGPVLSWVLPSLLAAYLALYPAMFCAVASRFWCLGPVAVLIVLPAVWVITEWVREWAFGGFPWNPVYHAWLDVPGALPVSSWIGGYGVAFLVILLATSLALAIRREWLVGGVGALAVVVILILGARYAPVSASPEAARGVPVRVLQPNTQNLVEWDRELVERNYSRLLEMSVRACDELGALLIWPESAAWPFSFERDERLRQDLLALVRRGCPVFFNSPRTAGADTYNSAFLVSAEAAVAFYDKRHLVPYGEYVPFSGWLPSIDSLARAAGSFSRGDSAAPLAFGREELGVAICYEVIFPREVAVTVREGATLLVSVTNDAWYGDTTAPWQHLAGARFRAAESRRWLVRGAITGVSAIISPNGQLVRWAGVNEEATLEATLAGSTDLTPFTRAPWLVPLVCWMVLAFAIFLRSRGRA